MGCDIHMYLEKKIDGKWVSADRFRKDRDGWIDIRREKRIYYDRNYLLFSVLAGVREPLPGVWQKYPVNGFPNDASPQVKQAYDQWGCDAHTPSYLTLKDLKEVNWVQTGVIVSFTVTERQKEIYEYFKNKALTEKPGEPYLINSFMYDTIKEGWYSILETVMEPKRELEFKTIHALVPLSLICDEFYYKVISKLEKMAKNLNLHHDEIRLVFWFDN